MLVHLLFAYIINPLPMLAKAKTWLCVSSSYLASMLGLYLSIYVRLLFSSWCNFGVYDEVFNLRFFILVAR